jgi:3-oxoacyl-[acyl-carrier-protein] synthase-3
VLSTHLHSDGRYAEQLWTKSPGSFTPRHVSQQLFDEGWFSPKMEGREVFKHAVVRFPQVIEEALAANKISKDDLKLVIPHQANDRITEAVRHRLKLPPEKVFSNIAKYGNTTAASIPIALHEALLDEIIKDGDMVILAAFGSGFTWASAVLRW